MNGDRPDWADLADLALAMIALGVLIAGGLAAITLL